MHARRTIQVERIKIVLLEGCGRGGLEPIGGNILCCRGDENEHADVRHRLRRAAGVSRCASGDGSLVGYTYTMTKIYLPTRSDHTVHRGGRTGVTLCRIV